MQKKTYWKVLTEKRRSCNSPDHPLSLTYPVGEVVKPKVGSCAVFDSEGNAMVFNDKVMNSMGLIVRCRIVKSRRQPTHLAYYGCLYEKFWDHLERNRAWHYSMPVPTGTVFASAVKCLE